MKRADPGSLVIVFIKKIFFQYDKQAIHQLYSMIRNARGSLLTTINTENQYKEKVERLLTYLQKEYHLD
jgi:hypothetical protein